MTEAQTPDFEALLRRALTPIEPPSGLSERLETRFEAMTEAAFDELEALEAWEIEAIADPRNWGQLVYAGGVVAAGTGAAIGLALLKARQKAKQKNPVRRALRR